MRYIRKHCFIFSVLFFIFCFPQTIFAENVETLIEQTDDLYVPYGYRVSDTAQAALSGTFTLSFSEVLKKAVDIFFGALKMELATVGKITAAGILCGVFTKMLDQTSSWIFSALWC